MREEVSQMRKNKDKETEQTCCGGVPLRNGRCPICGDAYTNEDEGLMTIFVAGAGQKAGQMFDAREMNGCP